jgi:REP element-mobilizing transposase RayT
MARPLRIEYDGALYHVTSRGNERRAAFRDDTDRVLFLNTLAQVTERFHWICHAYCLMTNHYHLIIETPDGNLSRGMRQLNGVYTQAELELRVGPRELVDFTNEGSVKGGLEAAFGHQKVAFKKTRMPRANRHFLPGHVWHITHQCCSRFQSFKPFNRCALRLAARFKVQQFKTSTTGFRTKRGSNGSSDAGRDRLRLEVGLSLRR